MLQIAINHFQPCRVRSSWTISTSSCFALITTLTWWDFLRGRVNWPSRQLHRSSAAKCTSLSSLRFNISFETLLGSSKIFFNLSWDLRLFNFLYKFPSELDFFFLKRWIVAAVFLTLCESSFLLFSSPVGNPKFISSLLSMRNQCSVEE